MSMTRSIRAGAAYVELTVKRWPPPRELIQVI